MKIYEEILSLKEHKPWNGALFWYNEIIKLRLDVEFISYLEKWFEHLTSTELNNILWFEDETIIEFLESEGIDCKEYRKYFNLEKDER